MKPMKVIAQNKKARHDYELLSKYEAGIELRGGEVKSIKAGEISIREAYVTIRGGEAWLIGAYVKPYQPGQKLELDPTRNRRLLLNRTEISKLIGESKEKNHTVVPLTIGLSKGLVKLEIALAKGKKLYDKRASIKEREQKREAARATRNAARD